MSASLFPSPKAWRSLAPGLLLIAALLLLFHDTAAAMVTIWIRSETFAHAFLVPPIVVWLIWRRRAHLAVLQPRAAPWVLLPMAAVCAVWLLGQLAGLNAVTQFALVALLVLAVPAVFGLAVARALTFPLLFLFFAVPFGEFMVPQLMEWTADFTISAVQMSGVPVYREGLQFVIPSGSWSVVEACSGVRYLIASFMVGTLFAYLNFRSPRRRALFIAVSLLVPIVANWFRAYMIVMLGHLSGNELATGVDHIVYGWVFFGIVIGLMFFIGARFAEPDELAPQAATPDTNAVAGTAGTTRSAAAWPVGAAVVLLLLGTQAAFWRLDNEHGLPLPTLQLPATFSAEWGAAAEPVTDWTPNFNNARATASASYVSGDTRVGLWVGYYREQGYEHKMVSSMNTMAALESEAPWQQTAAARRSAQVAGQTLDVNVGNLRGSSGAGMPAAQRLRVWQMYWIGGRFIASDARARLQIAINRLLGRGDDAAVVFFYTPIASDVQAAQIDAADAALARFVEASAPPLAGLLQAAGR